MSENDWLSEQFETHRNHLRAVAYRMLGSAHEADDAVQESWLRLSRANNDGVQNMGGWMTTIVARVCLDMLRSRKSRPEAELDEHDAENLISTNDDTNPEHEAQLADSVGLALLVVLETLPPAERLAFVLHDLFAVPFEEIANIVDRSPDAARQLASRARRRVQAASTPPEANAVRQREIVAAFLAASRNGEFEALLTMLDPDVVLRSDQFAAQMGSPAEIRGANAFATFWNGRAKAARLVLFDGAPGAAWFQGSQLRVAFMFTLVDGKITAIDLVADPARLEALEVTIVKRTKPKTV